MSRVAQLNESKNPAQKPVILCDVSGTLLIQKENEEYGWKEEVPNQPLIRLLNAAVKQGFKVQICTGNVDSGTWHHDYDTLRKDSNIDPLILCNACGKDHIKSNTFSNVAAIIDDDKYAHYIHSVKAGNPDAQYFHPIDGIETLLRQLQVMKPKGAELH